MFNDLYAAKSLQLCPTLCDPIDGSMKVKSESEVAQPCQVYIYLRKA